MRAPVLLIIFNRPDTTTRVLAEIAKAKPAKLFVFGDGPRPNRPDDIAKCAAARALVEHLDWECELTTNFLETNLGCGRGPAEGISWVFQHTDRAIILEDDCVPHPSFFQFCDELLEMYKDDQRVMHIAGNNFQLGRQRTPCSYFFSMHNLCAGGWATWRRAWRFHDMGLTDWPELRDTSWLTDIVEHPRAVAYWREMFDRAYASGGQIDYWDYQWTFACWSQNGLSLLPNKTLLSNIGFGHADATHTTSAQGPLADMTANLQMEDIGFPLRHPTSVTRVVEADRFFVDHVVNPTIKRPAARGFSATQYRRWHSLIAEHPSLASPTSFSRRVCQKCLLFLGKNEYR